MKISELEYNPKQSLIQSWTTPKMPLEMRWNPKPDITAYELSLCLPYMLKNTPTYPDDIDVNEPHFRHFEIINHNK